MNVSMETRQAALAWLRAEANRFAKGIAPVYQVLNWKWALPPGKARVPQVKDIKASILRLVESMEENPDSEGTGSGGIMVSIDKDPEGGTWECSITFSAHATCYHIDLDHSNHDIYRSLEK